MKLNWYAYSSIQNVFVVYSIDITPAAAERTSFGIRIRPRHFHQYLAEWIQLGFIQYL